MVLQKTGPTTTDDEDVRNVRYRGERVPVVRSLAPARARTRLARTHARIRRRTPHAHRPPDDATPRPVDRAPPVPLSTAVAVLIISPTGSVQRTRPPPTRRKHRNQQQLVRDARPRNMAKAKGCEAFLSDLDQLPCIQIGDFKLRLELDDDLSPELQNVAIEQLRETPEQQAKSIAELKALLEADKDLKAPIDNEAWLIRFLRPTKYYPESAYKLIKQYYQFKVKHSNIYKDLTPRTEKNIFDHDILHVLPKRDQGGRRILVIELGKKWKHKKCSLDEVYKGAVIFLEAAIMEPATQVAGAQVIFDMDGLSLQQTWQFSPPFAKRIVDWLQDSVPARVKGIHIVNQPVIFNVVFNFFKPFLREKLRSRIIFHGTDRASLHKYLYQPCLPESYGGTLDVPRITGPQWYELLMTVTKEFEVINKYGYKQ